MDTLTVNSHPTGLPVVCRACEARYGGICSALNATQLNEINRQSTRRVVAAGCELIGQGERVSHYSNILRGVVKLSKMMADGRQQIVGLQFAPDFLGRPFQDESNLTAEAATSAEICTFPRSMLDRMVAETPELERRLHNQSLKELDEARSWMLTLGRKTAKEKVASFLYMIATHIDPETIGTSRFDLPLSRSDIADFLGLTIETVSRQVTKLRLEGTISIEHNRQVTVPSLERLNDAAGNE